MTHPAMPVSLMELLAIPLREREITNIPLGHEPQADVGRDSSRRGLVMRCHVGMNPDLRNPPRFIEGIFAISASLSNLTTIAKWLVISPALPMNLNRTVDLEERPLSLDAGRRAERLRFRRMIFAEHNGILNNGGTPRKGGSALHAEAVASTATATRF